MAGFSDFCEDFFTANDANGPHRIAHIAVMRAAHSRHSRNSGLDFGHRLAQGDLLNSHIADLTDKQVVLTAAVDGVDRAKLLR